MATKELAVKEAALPALAPTPATENIRAEDMALPRLYRGETQSSAFKDDLVPKGCIFVAFGGDDPNPEVIAQPGESVRAHFLQMYQRYSKSVDGEFQSWALNDPEAPADADLDYHYVVVLPEVDPDIPVKVTFAKTSVPTAKRINFQLKKAEASGRPGLGLAFDLSLKERKSEKAGQKYQWYVWQARLVEADDAHIEAAAKAAQLAAGPARNDIETRASASDAPAI